MDTQPKSQSQTAEWWFSLEKPRQAIFKVAIGIKSEPTEKELVVILGLTRLNCGGKKLTRLEPFLTLTGFKFFLKVKY